MLHIKEIITAEKLKHVLTWDEHLKKINLSRPFYLCNGISKLHLLPKGKS